MEKRAAMNKRTFSPKGITDEQILEAMKPVLKAPSLKEVSKKVGLSGSSGIYKRLKRLIKEGKVVKVGVRYYPSEDWRNK